MKKIIITEEERNNIIKLHGLVNEQVVDNVTQLVKDIISFIWSMNIVPGPIDAAKLLYDIYQTGQPIETIKNYVKSKISSPGENWTKIENDLDRLGNDAGKFKDILYQELKSKLGI